MSRSGLFRAAALLAVGAAPLLAGTAHADELSAVDGGVPDVGADKLITDATQHVKSLGKTVKLPTVTAPVGQRTAQLSVPQERTLPSTAAPELGALPGLSSLPGTDSLLGGTHFGDLQTPHASDLPTNTVLSGILPTING
ncbi:hypothetical protein [Nocardia sp. NRRL S-836]|uniref:hypothetical protein n=1 Tax=Nocardia sp. NRRL S-836 TaxID=1519492 RepID=UPI0006B0121A|nr:hypothetical protein [Nocardia sp. NRRL S-836]KOV84450.1 hypothetical protein ADL03_16185 [Nocardia sp. NRRL S-836]